MVLGLNVDVMIEVASRACMQYRDNQNASSPDDHMLLLSVAATYVDVQRTFLDSRGAPWLHPSRRPITIVDACMVARSLPTGMVSPRSGAMAIAGGPSSVPLCWAPWASAMIVPPTSDILQTMLSFPSF